MIFIPVVYQSVCCAPVLCSLGSWTHGSDPSGHLLSHNSSLSLVYLSPPKPKTRTCIKTNSIYHRLAGVYGLSIKYTHGLSRFSIYFDQGQFQPGSCLLSWDILAHMSSRHKKPTECSFSTSCLCPSLPKYSFVLLAMDGSGTRMCLLIESSKHFSKWLWIKISCNTDILYVLLLFKLHLTCCSSSLVKPAW